MGINIGDVVTLKSGSPLLTVTCIEGQMTTCVLFRNGEVKHFDFPVAALEPFKLRSEAPRWMRLIGLNSALSVRRAT